jgi:hypothetical protein
MPPEYVFLFPNPDFRPTASFFQTCENFAQLAKRGYYNGLVFHRIVAVCCPLFW